MSDNQVAVRITGEATVGPAANQAKADVASIAPAVQQLNDNFTALGAQMRESFTAGMQASAGLQESLVGLHGATEAEAAGLRGMALAAKENAESVLKFREIVSGFAEVFIAAFAVDQIIDFSKEMGEASEKTQLLSQRLGISTGDVQRLSAMAELSQGSIDAMAGAIAKLDKAQEAALAGGKQQALAFQQLGVDIEKPHTNMELLSAAMDKFSSMADGPAKVALAMDLFGRSGAELIPILSASKEQQAEFNKALDEYGVINETAVAKGNALAEAWDTNALAVMGLRNVFTDAFAPVLTEIQDSMNAFSAAIIESYNQGGIAADIFRAISIVIEATGAEINAVGAIFADVFMAVVDIVAAVGSAILDVFGVKTPTAMDYGTVALNVFKDAITILKDVVIIAVELIKGGLLGLIEVLRTFAVVARDALTLNWGAIEGDWQSGINRVVGVVASGASRVAQAAREAGQAWDAALQGKALDGAKPENVDLPKAGGNASAPTASTTAKKDGDDLVQILDQQLKARQLAWAMEQDAQGKAQAYSIQSIADYWKEALQRDDLSSKDRLAIEERYLAAHSQIIAQDKQVVIDSYKQQLAEYQGNSAEKMRIAIQEANFMRETYGQDSREYRAALSQVQQFAREAAQQREQIARMTSDAEARASTQAVAADEAAARQRVQAGQETQNELFRQLQDFENRKFQISQQALQRSRDLLDPERDPIKVKQLDLQLEELRRQHEQRITQIQQQAELQRTAIQRTAISSTGRLWGQNIGQLLTLQQGFASTVANLYQGMVNIISTALGTIIEQWIEQQLAAFLFKRTAQAADGAASVTSNAGVAGSAAYASTAAIPIIGPALAPAAAATAVAGALSFLPMASAEGGWWQVAPGLAELHKDEMVLPAWAASPLRSMLAGVANNNAPSAANDGVSGGFHYHDHTERGVSRDQIIANRAAVAKAVKMAHREGHFAGTGFMP